MQLADIKPAIANRIIVSYKGTDYYVTGCIARFQDSEWIYQLELHDLKANSVTIARIEEVEIEGEEK